MFKNRAVATSIGLALGFGLFLVLLWALGSKFPVVHAQGPDGHSVYYVAPSCTGVPAPCYTTVQAAVDAADAPTDVIKVAAGTYTGVSNRGGLAQVVYISKTVTIRGGYTTAFTDPPNPDTNPTTLDAQEQGRVIYITGTISPTLEGLHITGGRATGLGGHPWGRDAGGGVYINRATPIISDCAVYDNTASTTGNGYGGGLFLYYSAATLFSNTVSANTANDDGGGLYLYNSSATLSGNTVSGNTVLGGGGGLFLSYSSAAILGDNTVSHNTALGSGGGLCLSYSNATLSGNTVSANIASDGGGLYLSSSAATISSNTVSANTAAYNGGGLHLSSSAATISGNTVSANTARGTGGSPTGGGGLYLSSSAATISGNTISANTASQGGGGLYLYYSTATVSGNTVSTNTANYGGGLCLHLGDATLVNNFVTDNALTWGHGGGLYVHGSSPQLRHNTIARNHGGGGEGLYVTGSCTNRASRPQLHNTILAYQYVGIYVTGNSSAQLEGTLWYSNTSDWIGNVTTGTVNVWGDPGFVDPDNGDYHINANSAAVDAGAYPTLSDDIDGDARPAASGPDIGADERPGPGLQLHQWASQDTRNPGQTVTYTLVVTGVGTGQVDSVALTDILPVEQRVIASTASMGPSCTSTSVWGGQVNCTLGTLGVGGSAHITITARVTTSPPPTLPRLMRNSAWVTGAQASSFAYADVYLQDCHVRLNDGTTEWDSVQAAVDASTGPADVVKVAGTCAGINTRGGVQQVVYISKTVTVRGGYSPANWTAPDPDINPTTLDAVKHGRVIYIAGNISPTLEGLRIANGLAADSGGGIYAANAHLVISDCRILDNIASLDGGGLYLHPYYYRDVTLIHNIVSTNTACTGGGLYLSSRNATLSGNTITTNAATYDGGGLYLYSSGQVVLSGNAIFANTAQDRGGGLYLCGSGDVTLSGNTISANTAQGNGGGMLLSVSGNATLSGNAISTNAAQGGGGGLFLSGNHTTVSGTIVTANSANDGGGLYLYWNAAMLSSNAVISNSALHNGGGLYVGGSNAILINTVVADNRANVQGSGLYISDSSPRLLHSTIARNSGGDGSGVHVTSYCCGYYSTVALTNTILVSHTVGITVAAGNTATLEATLWGSGAWANEADRGGAGIVITGTHNYWGDPDFVDPEAGDYHIGFDSAAIGKGVDAGVTTDLDGNCRGTTPDLGADELSQVYMPVVLRQYQ